METRCKFIFVPTRLVCWPCGRHDIPVAVYFVGSRCVSTVWAAEVGSTCFQSDLSLVSSKPIQGFTGFAGSACEG